MFDSALIEMMRRRIFILGLYLALLCLAHTAHAAPLDDLVRARTLHNRVEAMKLVHTATRAAPDDLQVHALAVEICFSHGNVLEAEPYVRNVRRLAPSDPAGYFWNAIVLGHHRDFEAARVELEAARALGLDAATYEKFRDHLADAQPWYERVWPYAWRIAAVWILVGALLIVFGLGLSVLTLRAARLPASASDGRARGLEHALRRLYAFVIGAASFYYYASLPIVAASVVLIGGGLIYAFFAAGRIPVQLVAMIAVGIVLSLYALARSLVVKVKDEDPGKKLDLAEAPKLRALLDEVAARIGTRPVDSVYLTVGADVAVIERGRLRDQLNDTSERALILGVAVLDDFPLDALRAILAHEYGHFINRDTAGGRFALAVRRALHAFAFHLASGGAATWFNPAWLFVSGYYKIFTRISHGASRLQETLADRWAATAYGGEAFARGLRHVIEREARFSAHSCATLQDALDNKLAITNFYRHVPSTPVSEEDIAVQIEAHLGRESSAYDSHPAPKDRIAWARAIRASSSSESRDAGCAWDLFEDALRKRIERDATIAVRDNVRANTGHEIRLLQSSDVESSNPLPGVPDAASADARDRVDGASL